MLLRNYCIVRALLFQKLLPKVAKETVSHSRERVPFWAAGTYLYYKSIIFR